MPGLSTLLLIAAVVVFLLVVLSVNLGSVPMVGLGLLLMAGAMLADHMGWGDRFGGR